MERERAPEERPALEELRRERRDGEALLPVAIRHANDEHDDRDVGERDEQKRVERAHTLLLAAGGRCSSVSMSSSLPMKRKKSLWRSGRAGSPSPKSSRRTVTSAASGSRKIVPRPAGGGVRGFE